MVYLLEGGELGLGMRLDVTLGWECPLGQPAALPTSLKSGLTDCQVSNIPAAFADKKVTVSQGTCAGEGL